MNVRIDVNSRTWHELTMYLNQRLDRCREKNDNGKLDATETAMLRGEIAAIKDLLALPLQVASVERDDPGYGTDSLDA